MTTLENAFEFHKRGLKDVMEDPMEGYRYQTLHDSQMDPEYQTHSLRVASTLLSVNLLDHMTGGQFSYRIWQRLGCHLRL